MRGTRVSARKTWIISVAAVAGAVALLAALVYVVAPKAGKPTDPAAAQAPIEPQLLAPISRTTPEQGWRITPHDISPKADSIGTRIGEAGDRVFFHSEGSDASWVYGINTTTGKLLYPAVQIDEESARCFLNGPGAIVCLYTGYVVGKGTVNTAWVIDTGTGKITYQGTTDVQDTALTQVGQYAVGSTIGEGWWGIGAQGERTWRVPGSGNPGLINTKLAPTLPAQRLTGGELDGDRTVIFAVADGRVLTREASKEPQIYPGGYADTNPEHTTAHIYDENGAVLNTIDGQGPNSVRIVSTPISEAVILAVGTSTPRWRIFDHTGKQYADFDQPSSGGSNNGLQVIGGRLFAQNYGDTISTFDMKTGAQLKECDSIHTTGLVGTDSNTYIFEALGEGPKAVDITTCQVLWTLEGKDRMAINTNGTLLLDDYSSNEATAGIASLKPAA
ncbi:Uncharacterised protein [Mycobacteroides abscessus subsp. abscessus]|nr:Uncharacterised protein [Mycobacteroides abscessus subsp. abscessus]